MTYEMEAAFLVKGYLEGAGAPAHVTGGMDAIISRLRGSITVPENAVPITPNHEPGVIQKIPGGVIPNPPNKTPCVVTPLPQETNKPPHVFNPVPAKSETYPDHIPDAKKMVLSAKKDHLVETNNMVEGATSSFPPSNEAEKTDTSEEPKKRKPWSEEARRKQSQRIKAVMAAKREKEEKRNREIPGSLVEQDEGK